MKFIYKDDFGSIEEFAEWYFDNGAPIQVPGGVTSFITEVDTATAVTVYRAGRWQAELYLLLPNRNDVTIHSHPNVETLTYVFAPITASWHPTPIIYDLETHGAFDEGVVRGPEGKLILTFERWDEGIPMTNVAIQWKGDVDGPKHRAMVFEKHPKAIVGNQTIDITKVHRVEPNPNRS